MRTCNHMLKSSMGMPATPLGPPPRATAGVAPEIALDAVGPVLETVLQNLTAVSGAACREVLVAHRSWAHNWSLCSLSCSASCTATSLA